MNQRRTYLLPFGVALALLITLVATMTRNVPVAQAAGNVTLSVAHFAPFADTVNDTSVTVRVNGGDLITEFVFAEVESSIVVPAGVYTIEVIPSGSVTPAMTSAPTELMADTEYFIAAVGGANGYDLALYPLVINKTPAPTSAKLRVSHLAPFATPSSATAVDICTDTNTPVIEGLTYLSSTAYLELAPATYDLKIAVSGSDCATVALDLAPFTLRAVTAALAIQAKNTELNRERTQDGRPLFELGIGVATGEAIAGYIGSPERMEFTVVGDKVNTARRLCSLAEPGQVIVSQETYTAVRDKVTATPIGTVMLKGKEEPVHAYVIEGLSG